MTLDDIFGDKEIIDLEQATCHSGGANGSDTYWEDIGADYGVTTKAYSYKTKYHTSKNVVEISDSDYEEGVEQINKANHVLNRFGINKYMNLLARNWAQIKYSDQVFAIGTIIDPGKKGSKGYYNRSKLQQVDGGTGYACYMAIQNGKDVFVFDQSKERWFQWSFITDQYKPCLPPSITSSDFAGIGTRDITNEGIEAIEGIYERTKNLE